jgi:phosphoenolpyruvate carboxykinase (ATP)
VPVDPLTRTPDFDSKQYTENTRAAYPVDFIPGCELSGVGGHPKNVFFLACDAFGVLPPLSKLTTEQAMEYFLCGYTAKIPGTEVGVTEPVPEFSTCFAKPFLPLPPKRYAALLKDKLERHNVPVWLVNTGWTGGPYGIGKRMSLPHTRALLRAALTGQLKDVPFEADPVFKLKIPATCPGVPESVLRPRDAWADKATYDAKAKELDARFKAEFQKYA